MVKIIFKIALSFGLLYWVNRSGVINWGYLTEAAVQHPLILAITFIILAGGLISSSVRGKLILDQMAETPIPLKPIFFVTWMGNFFNAVLPGAVTGDFIKIVYLKNFSRTFTTKSLLSAILIDRLFGLLSLILLMGVSTFLFPADKLPEALVWFQKLLFLGGIVAYGVYLALPQCPAFLTRIKFIDALWTQAIGLKKASFSILGISLVNQSMIFVAFWILAKPFSNTPLDLSIIYQTLPLGFITIAIPISPSGMGVGHAAFQQLFSYYGIQNGASLFNLYFACSVLLNLTGIAPYLWNKSHQPNPQTSHSS